MVISLVGDPVFGHPAQPAGQRIGDLHARHALLEVGECAQRADRAHAGQDVAALVQPEVADLGHPPP